MSFLKFWKGRPKGVSRGGYPEEMADPQNGAMADQGEIDDMDNDKKGKLKHSLSISRSGRYKAKKKERLGFLDKPDMFDGPDNEPNPNPSQKKSSVSKGANNSPSSSQRGSQPSSHRRNSSNPSSCRDGPQISSLRLKHPPGLSSQQPTAV